MHFACIECIECIEYFVATAEIPGEGGTSLRHTPRSPVLARALPTAAATAADCRCQQLPGCGGDGDGM
jgi:hypothetical protein